jgi:hypothetical protein
LPAKDAGKSIILALTVPSVENQRSFPVTRGPHARKIYGHDGLRPIELDVVQVAFVDVEQDKPLTVAFAGHLAKGTGAGSITATQFDGLAGNSVRHSNLSREKLPDSDVALMKAARV